MSYPKDLHLGDKYIFTSVLSENRAFGWSSPTKQVGFWLINPSMEYISGGPTKVEFLGHRDTNAVSAPCVLNYWRSSHYGGAVVDVTQGEHWTKVIGPFLIYANAGKNPQEMYNDAVTQAGKESKKWPYDWVSGVDYAKRNERATVSGRLVLRDPQAKNTKLANMRVGLSHPAYVIQPVSRTGATSSARTTWTTSRPCSWRCAICAAWARPRSTWPTSRPGASTVPGSCTSRPTTWPPGPCSCARRAGS